MTNLDTILSQISEAQRRADEPAVVALADQAKKLMGSKAGIPDKQPTILRVPAKVPPLADSEIATAFIQYEKEIARTKWWRIGDDPTKTKHPLRDIASIVTGCVFAARAGCNDAQGLLAIARSGADYLLWAQAQGGRGLFPFPAVRHGSDRAFEVSERMIEKGAVIHNGWIVDDLGDGGLQYDNGVCGVAVLELYRTTHDVKYLNAAQAAADWAITQPAVINWNYNSFSVYLIAEVATELGSTKINAATKKARLGIYPGQLTTGPRAGNWFDPHNAEIAYHFILVRSLVALRKAQPRDKQAADALVLALHARESEFTATGIPDVESALEALVMLGADSAALRAIAAYCVSKVRTGGLPVAPGAWGRYLAYARGRNK